MKHAIPFVDPGTDARLEQFHPGADDVEQDDHAQLAQRLKPERHHQNLDGDGSERDEVVAREGSAIGIPHGCREQQNEHRRTEHAGPALLEREHRELDEPARRAALRNALQDSVGARIDVALDCGAVTATRRLRLPHGLTIAETPLHGFASIGA